MPDACRHAAELGSGSPKIDGYRLLVANVDLARLNLLTRLSTFICRRGGDVPRGTNLYIVSSLCIVRF